MIKTQLYKIVERMTNEWTTVAPFTMKIKDELPDGNISTVGAERFRCVEVLFQPGFIDQEAFGIHDISIQNVMKCDVDTRKEMYAMSRCHLARPCSKKIESMTQELTALSPSTMRSRWLLHRQIHHHCRRYTFPLCRSVFFFFQPSFSVVSPGDTTMFQEFFCDCTDFVFYLVSLFLKKNQLYNFQSHRCKVKSCKRSSTHTAHRLSVPRHNH